MNKKLFLVAVFSATILGGCASAQFDPNGSNTAKMRDPETGVVIFEGTGNGATNATKMVRQRISETRSRSIEDAALLKACLVYPNDILCVDKRKAAKKKEHNGNGH